MRKNPSQQLRSMGLALVLLAAISLWISFADIEGSAIANALVHTAEDRTTFMMMGGLFAFMSLVCFGTAWQKRFFSSM